jgi:hypothetical protein
MFGTVVMIHDPNPALSFLSAETRRYVTYEYPPLNYWSSTVEEPFFLQLPPEEGVLETGFA